MTLLPANATKYERALEKTCARSFDLPVLINTLRNPWECPLNVLPWLAYEWSVDEWNESWTEQQKRATVAASIAVHKKKGTRGAVEDALNALDINVLAAEWWEFEPKQEPGTFALRVDDVMQAADAYTEVVRVVNAAKNTRSHLSYIEVPQSTPGEISIGGIVRQTVELGATLPLNPQVGADIVAGGLVRMCPELTCGLPSGKLETRAKLVAAGYVRIQSPLTVQLPLNLSIPPVQMICGGLLRHNITLTLGIAHG